VKTGMKYFQPIQHFMGIEQGRQCGSPEQVYREDSDGKQEVDCIEEHGDDHTCSTRLVSSIEVPIKLCCVSQWHIWAVGETLRRH